MAALVLLFLAWPLEVGSALRFLVVPSGAGVSLGLVGLGFGALPPYTLAIARSVGAVFVASAALRSVATFRRFGAGVAPVVALDIPRPTEAAASAGALRDFALPCDFLGASWDLPSPSVSAACALEFFFAANACFRSLLRAAASSASCWAAAESVAAPSRRDRSACALAALETLFST